MNPPCLAKLTGKINFAVHPYANGQLLLTINDPMDTNFSISFRYDIGRRYTFGYKREQGSHHVLSYGNYSVRNSQRAGSVPAGLLAFVAYVPKSSVYGWQPV
jgi:hypothetical protein